MALKMYYVQYAQVCRCVYYTCMRILQCVFYTCSRLVALRASQQSTLLDPRQFHAQLLRAGALGLGLVRLCAARPSAPPLLLYSCSCLGRCYSLRNLEQLALTSPYSLVASTVHWLLSQDLSHYPVPSPVSGGYVAAPGRPGRTVWKLWIQSLSHFPTSSSHNTKSFKSSLSINGLYSEIVFQ